MIAAVKGCPAVLSALLLLLPRYSWAADDLSGAARELARKTAAFAGRGEPVSVSWRNLSGLGSAELAQARAVFDSALREAGVRPTDVAQVAEARLAISENQSQYLMVEEARKGDEHQVWIASWRRAAPAAAPGVSLEKKLLWEQPDPILDAVPNGNDLLILSPAGVLLRGERSSQSAAITPIRPWPRDLRGRLRITAGGFKVNLPGMSCNGTFEPALTVDCRSIDEPWTLDAGSRGILLAGFAPTRNYFDGRVVTPAGVRKSVAAFYAVAAIEDQGRPYWILTLVDGRTQLFDAAFEPAGTVGPWGSDVAATEARCAGGTQVLATKPGDLREPDSLRAWSIVNRAPVALTPPADLPGPVTALWSLGGAGALAVVHDLTTGRYSAYIITVVCGA
jgi:hypothetical protein